MSFISVVSYNILSPDFGNPDLHAFTSYDKEHVNPEKRWEKIKTMILEWINSDKVICLQEVNAEWAGRLYTLCLKKATVVGTTYSNGRLGVYTIVPRSLDLKHVEIIRPMSSFKEEKERLISESLSVMHRSRQQKSFSYWGKSKFNSVLPISLQMAKVQVWESPFYKLFQRDIPFVMVKVNDMVIANIHVPCMYRDEVENWARKTYTFYSIQKLTSHPKLVVAGDFNDTTDEQKCCNLSVAHLQQRPTTRNTINGCLFEGKLDRILFTGLNCDASLYEDIRGKVLPDIDHPSDHIPIEATFS